MIAPSTDRPVGGLSQGSVSDQGDVERVAAVCRELGLDDAASGELPSVRAALRSLAVHDLLDLPVFGEGEFSTNDLRRIASTIDALAARSGPLSSIYLVNAVIAGAVIAMGANDQQRRDLLPLVRKGEVELAFAMTEPNAGSDAGSLTTSATRDEEGFLLNGEKIYSTGASTADWIIVVARLAMKEKRALGLFLVSQGAEGLRIKPLNSTRGDVHASCRVWLENVRVNFRQVVGGDEQLGKAWELLRRVGTIERVAVAAMATGLAGAVETRAKDFALHREQFGQPIAAFQAIKHTLVEMHIAHRAMRLFLDDAVSAFETASASESAAAAKCFCSDQLQQILASGMRVMGGRAYFDFEDMARFYREAPFSLYAGGTTEIQKMLIARAIGLS